ncbi:WYL domain-containing protein [Arsenicicoccus piscis]|uniref:WYL domain-containing protein n=1 Tax=Arsenicicoccus piscis TaxID=673954 RepID=A0ABQ6HP20_9MICO|nr:WYL domain-containing protein [Arsenicicoccus piscis]MCH8628396.1 WYL domain-containing protein [Arsenicicoccus piscis]MCH8629309.1 WYL domain-containing protein [Arsenicicoccus piscis]GMA19727.1 WYL domain-containing protein [Arsenicicoccus piscis]GMA22021.1 WYL domain-containing protein [Arsenicicoccus piscis]
MATSKAKQPKTPISAAKTERLLNLVIALLYTRQALTKVRIRDAVEAYHGLGDEAFARMFERDKDELRAMGIPLVTEQIDTWFEDEEGYRIDRREYALPEVRLEPDEIAVLSLASRTWSQASLAGPAARAMRKLEAAGVERDDRSLLGVDPQIRTTEPGFERAKDAVLGRRPIRFDYRKGAAGTTTRHLQPWGLARWHGRWYLTGHDVDRDAPRVFRLGRVVGPIQWAGRAGSYVVPPDHDPLAMVRTEQGAAPATRAVLRVRGGAGQLLRRRATATRALDDGWDELDLDYTSSDALVGELASHGADVLVLEPPALREAVVARLRGALGHRDGRTS